MSLKDRFAAAWQLLPASRLLLLAIFAVSLTWYSVYRSRVNFINIAGNISIESFGRLNLAIHALDTTTVILGLLAYVGAGLIAVPFLMRKPTEQRAIVAQLVWIVLIAGAVYYGGVRYGRV